MQEREFVCGAQSRAVVSFSILICVSLNISDFLNAKHYFNLDILSQPATLGVPGLDLWSRARPSLVSPCQQNIRFINTVILDSETRLDRD